ncbi:MAG: hypothetical protein A2381_03825 [Bdellovibrionales bacterium RIFOXYB1_FULL_37_110]|nr:MAG: hypothetical protein A2381_03825 [Bdellovibrionales bacterium RIFOXYB1_FULL_37_110]OFZ64170.1 MAG: hypothetical protein A2577_14855 [Bdellovibrionales bacterium RIFOXYD1_FULL_36_51]
MKIITVLTTIALFYSTAAWSEERYCPTSQPSTKAKIEVWFGPQLRCSTNYYVPVFERKDIYACIPRPVYTNTDYECNLGSRESLVLNLLTVVKIDQQTLEVGKDVVTELDFFYINERSGQKQKGWIEVWNSSTNSTDFIGEKILDSGFRIKAYSVK